MILEHALLDVVPGQEAAFETAFAEAKAIISSMKGFVSLRLERCIESPSRYLLLVEWETLEDHTAGFRGSAEYQQWRALLHHFYDPFPTVEHYSPVAFVR
jgi:heme-degrading monooxygenase HmoA